MAITYIQGKASGNSASSITLDATPQVGDLLVAHQSSWGGGDPTYTWPAGWTLAAPHVYDVGTQFAYEMRYRIAGASEPTSISGSHPLQVGVWRGLQQLDPSAPTHIKYTAQTSCPLPTLTPIAGRDVLFVVGLTGVPDINMELSNAQGYTRHLDQHDSGGGSRRRLEMLGKIVTGVSGSYNPTITLNGNADHTIWVHRAFDADGPPAPVAARAMAVIV